MSAFPAAEAMSASPEQEKRASVPGNGLATHPDATCSVCAKPFRRQNSLAIVCSLRCARQVPVRARKAEKAQDKARREALKSRSDWLKEAQQAFNAYIRARDQKAGHACICCGQPLDWGAKGVRGHSVDAGHYRSTGSAPHLRFDEANCHAQRVVCNRYGAGRAVDYRIGLVARIGLAEVERLEGPHAPRKYTAEDLRAIRDKYRAKVREFHA